MVNSENIVQSIEAACPNLQKSDEYIETGAAAHKTVIVFEGEGDVSSLSEMFQSEIESMPGVTGELTHNGAKVEFEARF
jgi:hypothetical protein